MARMFKIKVLIVKCLKSRLYPILPRLAKTKLRGLVAITNINQIEDQAVD
jgi:hypothetical protein